MANHEPKLEYTSQHIRGWNSLILGISAIILAVSIYFAAKSQVYSSPPYHLDLVVLSVVLLLVFFVGVRNYLGGRMLARQYILVGSDPGISIVASTIAFRRKAALMRRRQSHAIPPLPQVATFPEALELLASTVCHGLIVEDRLCPATNTVRDCRGKRVPVLTASQMLEKLTGRAVAAAYAQDSSLPVFSARSPLERYSKRTCDVILALVSLAVLALPIAVTCIILRLTGERNPLVRTTCVGLAGRTFAMLQFNFQSVPKESAAEQENLVLRFNRRFKQLLAQSHFRLAPALLSILRGHMSFVGPCTETVESAEIKTSYVPNYRMRFMVLPGIFSLARVRFDYSNSPRDTRLAFEYDLYYLKHRSTGMELAIFVRALAIGARDGWQACVAGVLYLFRRTRLQLHKSIQKNMGHTWLASAPMPIHMDRQATEPTPALLVGAGAAGRQLVQELHQHPDIGYWPVAFVDDDMAKIGTRVSNVPVLGTTASIPDLTQREEIGAVILAIPSLADIDRARIATIVADAGVQLLTVPSMATMLKGASASELHHVALTDLLGRPVVMPDMELCNHYLNGKTVLISGAAGSIGSEVVRQVAQSSAAIIYGLDVNESDLFDIQQELKSHNYPVPFVPIVCSITNVKRLRAFMQRTQPSIVFHAAAYKHVPLMEEYPLEAVEINTLGTYEFVNMAADSGVERFVLVSSDKAVRPSSVMGATKRIAELLVQAVARERGISCCAVRFGNVLGSRGSVIPLFEKQIANGGPVTVTDPHMMRYFMTIPEAARLIIHAAAMRDNNVIYMLDMGDEISILSLAERVIRMHGKEPGKDIGIKFVGLRPGEKLRESLSLDFEAASPTTHPKIRLLRESRNLSSTVPTVKQLLTSLHRIQRMSDASMIRQSILALVRRADGVVHEDDPVALTDREQAPSADVVTDVPMYLRGEWRGKQYSDVPTVDQ